MIHFSYGAAYLKAEADAKAFQEAKKAKGLVLREEWHKKHNACPVCGNTCLRMTAIGIIDRYDTDYEDNANLAYCDKAEDWPGIVEIKGCGWKGKANQLVESKDEIIIVV